MLVYRDQNKPINLSNKRSIHPSNTLGNQKLLQTLIRIKPSPSTIPNTSMRENRFVMDSHAIDMHSPGMISKMSNNKTRRYCTYPD